MSKGKRKLTWKDVVNSSLLKTISTGQLPVLGAIGLVAFLIYRTPPENITQVWAVLAELIDKRRGLGYSLSIVFGAGWVFHASYQRRHYANEMARIAKERDAAQQLHFKNRLKSSEG